MQHTEQDVHREQDGVKKNPEEGVEKRRPSGRSERFQYGPPLCVFNTGLQLFTDFHCCRMGKLGFGGAL